VPEFVRAIGVGRATAMVVGTIIGASIFVQPSAISRVMPSLGGVLLVWIVAGAITLIGALITAELSSAFPRTGGVYVFLKEAYSPAIAYLWGWAMFWSMHSGIIAAIATVFGIYLGYLVDLRWLGIGPRAFAVGSIVLMSAVNYVGVRHGSAVQALFTVIKLLAILLIVALGAVFVARHGLAVAYATAGGPLVPTVGAFVTALIAGLFAYGGWHMVTYASEETKEPTRTIPRALMVGTLIVTAAYIGVNAAYLAVLPIEKVASATGVAADFADAVLGSGGRDLLSLLVVLSTLGGMTGIILAGPRVYLAMARDGLLFRWAGSMHPRYQTPHVAIVLQAIWSSVLVLTGTYRALFTRVVYTEWIFFALMAASLFILRRRADYRPAYRLWGFPFLPGIFVLSSLAIVLHQLATQPMESLTGLALVAAGLPVYWFWTRAKPR
jgi:basic amino acid/polyamine antiporter, APA family